ncbi:hypothetical protein [Flavobacterium hydatis]|uniref:Uncharacterized protein n=1 Tax=Flavobacterium hydatis TaxID=991 RepID=A0A086AH91_FLAHY|nr:hypothetical protein [Flavobacterium hydatis]KFF16055.1 hypothetical protein IW20_11970 [Flavobacterium hydatis]OXA97593.1 hypothetical protein B0A62_01660 [Flavobacterium hydatis]
MHYIELLKATNKDFKIKFINILKDRSIFDTKELSYLYDILLDSKKVVIEFKESDLESLNNVVIELMDIGICFGDCSFHEEFE